MLGIERITRRGAMGVACSILGVALVMLGRRSAGPGAAGDAALLGSLLVFAASACWAVYTVLLQPYARRVNGLQLTALTLAGGCLPLLAVAARDLAATHWPASPLTAAQLAGAERGAVAGALAFFTNPWGAVLYGGLLAIVVAYVLFYRGMRILGPTRTAMYVNLQPAVALFVAWLTLGEVPSRPQALGALAILTGIVLTRK
jgi:drug/metabolite transporter (DMT)-like permease